MRRGSVTLWAVCLVVAASATAAAQTRVKTQVVRPASPPAATAPDPDAPAVTGTIPALKMPPAPAASEAAPEVLTDLSQLPPPVARMRERILAAARSGELNRLVAVMTSGE